MRFLLFDLSRLRLKALLLIFLVLGDESVRVARAIEFERSAYVPFRASLSISTRHGNNHVFTFTSSFPSHSHITTVPFQQRRLCIHKNTNCYTRCDTRSYRDRDRDTRTNTETLCLRSDTRLRLQRQKHSVMWYITKRFLRLFMYISSPTKLC